MTRKQFFAAIGGGIAVFSVEAKPVSLSRKGPDGVLWDLPDEFRKAYPSIQGVYREYGIYWTGWKQSQSFVFVVGQWIAYHSDMLTHKGFWKRESGKCLYASCPGGASAFSPGECFDICAYDKFPEQMMRYDPHLYDEAAMELGKAATLKRLLVLIDEQMGKNAHS